MRVHETDHADPRTLIEKPLYRIHFWHLGAPGHAHALDARVIEGADDVEQVLQWARQHAEGRPFEVFVEVDHEPVGAWDAARTTALVRVHGQNPNDNVVAVFEMAKS